LENYQKARDNLMASFDRDTKLYRVITIGDTAVGKTSIISQLVHGQFDSNQESTIGAMFVFHVETVGTRRVEMQVWDTAGQERFRSLGPIYYRNAAAAIAVFDVTSPESFDRITIWTNTFLEIAGDHSLVVLVGNKSDLRDQIAVPETRLSEWAAERGFKYILTSAKTGKGIPELFRLIAEEFASRERAVNQPTLIPKSSSLSNTASQGCC
jgi:small GTP-binding protein